MIRSGLERGNDFEEIAVADEIPDRVRCNQHFTFRHANVQFRPEVQTLRDHREKTIGALLLGNNLLNTTAAAITTALLAKPLGDFGIAVATVVTTIIVLIFAEVLPKTSTMIEDVLGDCAYTGAPINIARKGRTGRNGRNRLPIPLITPVLPVGLLCVFTSDSPRSP